MSAELVEHRSSLPEKKVKGKEYEELKQREEYLEFEVSPVHPAPACTATALGLSLSCPLHPVLVSYQPVESRSRKHGK